MDSLKFYVSPVGDDSCSGMIPVPSADGSDGPFATPAAARDAIRCYSVEKKGLDRPVTVFIQQGVYELDNTLAFGPEDSGTEECPIRYVAAKGASPVLSGGRRIENWQETELNGLRCWTAELPDVAEGKWNFTRLYVDHNARPRPRLPKSGFTRFTGIDGHEDSGFNWTEGPDSANFAPGDIRKWKNWEDVEIISYQLWFDTHHRIKDIDEDKCVVYFHANSLGSLKDERGEFARYFAENVFEAMDTPGEWYLDRASGRLFYLPLPGESLENTVVTAPRLEKLLLLQGDEAGKRVSHLRFENLTFAHQHWELPKSCTGYIQAAYGVPGALSLEGAEACVLYGCTVTHINGYGIEVLAGSTDNVLAACVVRDAGGGGIKIGNEEIITRWSVGQIRLSNGGEVPPIATTVIDCTIRDCGHIFPSAIGIWIANSGWNRIIHNHIFNCNYTGISCGWTWGYDQTRTVCNRIEYNHIHHINHKEILSDNGGIYTLGIQPGTTVKSNVIHDISCYGYGAWGIYPDEGSSEILVENNLVYGTKKNAFFVHYGRDILVRNNIFANSREEHLGLGLQESHRSTVFCGNIVIPANGRIAVLDWPQAHFTVTGNLYWPLDGSPLSFNGKTLEQMQENGQNTDAQVADPLFEDAAGEGFSLRPDSPAYSIGFKPFDWRLAGSRIGAEKPSDYDDYTQLFPIPAADVPVVHTMVELAASEDTGVAKFFVKLINVGRAQAKGSVSLSAGPSDAAGLPSLGEISFDLAPGESAVENVEVAVKPDAPCFWLDVEPFGDAVIPARKLVKRAQDN
ncbi:MAG: right-handed parallel beta-helix repeat-containing protein [Armatimonadota bacterium]